MSIGGHVRRRRERVAPEGDFGLVGGKANAREFHAVDNRANDWGAPVKTVRGNQCPNGAYVRIAGDIRGPAPFNGGRPCARHGPKHGHGSRDRQRQGGFFEMVAPVHKIYS